MKPSIINSNVFLGNFISCISACLLAALFIFCPFIVNTVKAQSPPLSSYDIRAATVWAVPAEQKVRPDDKIETNNLIWSQKEKTISVAGAGNEHVPFQVVITNPVPEGYEPEAPGGFFIEASNLISEQGERISKEQINFYLEHYILVYAKSSPVGGTGYWPDALAPIEEPFNMDAQYSVVRNRPIWVDLDIPSETLSGTYTGTITVTKHEETVDILNLEVEVYDFSLPEEKHLLVYMRTSRDRLARFYGKSPESEEMIQLSRKYYEFVHENRMQGWHHLSLQPEVNIKGENMDLTFDESAYDFFMNKVKTDRVPLETYPHELRKQMTAEPFSQPFSEIIQSYLRKVESYFSENGWEDKLVFNNPIDEPNSKEEYENTRKWGRTVEKAVPNVPFMATESPVAQNPDWGTLRDIVDDFSVHGNFMNDPEVKRAISEEQAEGGVLTWYISCDQRYPQPNYYIDAPAMDPVMVPWITDRYDMNGILYWATSWWDQTPNPWMDPVTFISGFLCSNGYVNNGEGSFFYPGDYTEEFTGQPDVYGPVSSIRFELLAEGIEDYEYLWMLKDLGAEEFAERQVRNLVIDISTFSRNRKELYLTREAMARRLEKLTR